MRNFGNRTITVQKEELIKKIKENKAVHIKAYEEALINYKKEALKQLTELFEKANNGDVRLFLNLITPVNNATNYDKIIEMFEWEVNSVVELEQKEFNEYVQDETDFAVHAKLSNQAYMR